MPIPTKPEGTHTLGMQFLAVS